MAAVILICAVQPVILVNVESLLVLIWRARKPIIDAGKVEIEICVAGYGHSLVF
ncbi:MAG TPA: hypothetical protein VE862_09830 [Candidatus Acidoferrum sp.]|nr:hypothetical protein [Candidatus Acidoferrum sp.]